MFMTAIETMKSILWSQQVIALCNDHPSITAKSLVPMVAGRFKVVPLYNNATPLNSHTHCSGVSRHGAQGARAPPLALAKHNILYS